jgi:hypothetical protein
MRSLLFLFVSISFVLLLMGVPLLAFSNASSSATQGYVAYQITLKSPVNQTSFIVNESSTATNQNGFVSLTLGLVSDFQNFSYSRDVNISAVPEIFPFIPGISNQSFSYETHGISIYAKITNAGTSSVYFSGKTYDAAKYAIDLSATNSSDGRSVSANGTLLALPSGLLYSAEIQHTSSGTLSVQLLATNLPLSDPSNTVSATEGAAMVGVGLLGAAAIAVPWKFRKRKNSSAASESPEKKPSYWVD